MRTKLTLIEYVVLVAIVVIIIVTMLSIFNNKLPENWRYDPYSGSTTWTDAEGRTLLRDENGNVRELSKTQH